MPVKIKTVFQDLVIKTMVSRPGIMRSKLFLQVMKIFPEMISARYDASVVKGEGIYKNVIRAGLMSIQNPPRRILDLCTGTGVATFIATQVFPEAKIVAVDQSEGMLKIAKAKADKTGLSSIEFKLVNAMQLTEPDASFDMIISSNAPVYLSEIARVLTPGGIFMTAFFFGGLSFVKLGREISALLGKHGLRLLALQSVGEGVYILSEKA